MEINSKPMLFECIDCKETYLADNLCDGYNCPKCNGHIVARGFIKDIEEGLKDMQSKIKNAKKNGLIRQYNNPRELKSPSIPSGCLCGLDLSSGKDYTIRISFNAKEFNEDLIEKATEELRNHRKTIHPVFL